jgi:ligand-binding SRPBCC domain-containing protein
MQPKLARRAWFHSQNRVLEARTVVPAVLEQVFDFFSRAQNLERLTPSNLSFKILTPFPIEMKLGATIDYRIRLLGVPFRWRTLITAWEPPFLFADDQARGPYQFWRHEHRFAATEGGTEINDRVEYRVAGGIFEPLVHGLFVGPQLKRIFDHRESTIKHLFSKEGP